MIECSFKDIDCVCLCYLCKYACMCWERKISKLQETVISYDIKIFLLSYKVVNLKVKSSTNASLLVLF